MDKICNNYEKELSNICVYLVKVPSSEKNECEFEPYFQSGAGEMIKACSSCRNQEHKEIVDIPLKTSLESLNDAISYYVNYGKDRFEIENIFTRYLNKDTN